MPQYPAMLNLTGRRVLVVGGGRVAARKIGDLLAAGARVVVVSPELGQQTAQHLENPNLVHEKREYQSGDLDGAWLVFCATDDAEVNRRVAQEAEEAGILVNLADDPAACGFTVPSSFTRGRLCVAVSTGGASPAAAARLRRQLEVVLGPEWGLFLEIMARVRDLVLSRGLSAEENKKIFRRLANSNLLKSLGKGDLGAAEGILADVVGPDCTLAALGFTPKQPEQGA